MSFDALAVEEILRSELGKQATFFEYTREYRAPMTVVLDEADTQLGRPFRIYWVANGPPELFCLPGFSPTPVVFSTRYLSLSAFVRHLFVGPFSEELVIEVSERTTLKIMAEMALRYGDVDYAVIAFLKSIIGKGIWLNDDDQIMELELEPKNEGYMATWFYGLAHELGHLHPAQSERFPDSHPWSDSGIKAAITFALEGFVHYPESMREEALGRATQRTSQSVLQIDQVRSEAIADMFATSLLFKTTYEVMREAGERDFEVVRFVQEMLIFLNIVALIDRCRRVAAVASPERPGREALMESALHPVSVAARGSILRQYLDTAVGEYLFDDGDLNEHREQATNLISEINDVFEKRVNSVDTGNARALEFSYYPERRENEWMLLDRFRQELMATDAYLERRETERFVALARGLGRDGKLLRALEDILREPAKPAYPDPTGDLVYTVPWVDGPNGFSRPFGLETKYGYLVFAFRDQNELFNAFFEASSELPPGFVLTKAAVLVPLEERLHPELAATMPSGASFRVVVEGTEIFRQCMEELSNGTIWED